MTICQLKNLANHISTVNRYAERSDLVHIKLLQFFTYDSMHFNWRIFYDRYYFGKYVKLSVNVIKRSLLIIRIKELNKKNCSIFRC